MISTLMAMNNMILMGNDAAYRSIMCRNSIINLACQNSQPIRNNRSLVNLETRLTQDMFCSNLQAKIAEASQESLNKQLNKDIKRSFSTFA